METFGPNADAVDSVIERAAQLTAAEAEKLAAAGNAWENAAWNAAWDAAWGAAQADDERLAAWDAAGDAAGDAAWGAAQADDERLATWGAAWAAARATAREAAWAAVVRDLISAEHYRILAGTWESVIGPVFPTDTDASPQH